ncbi:MAG TPA: GWxTD domain-containing protein [Gemmatimonadaceae bacterium]|nr:GWxTD domain-containing protein [Gemmatimonadaceae bacterium]
MIARHRRGAGWLLPPAVPALVALLVLGCAGRTGAERTGTGALPDRRTGDAALGFDAAAFYRQAGLLAAGAPVPFVGTVHFLSSGNADSTLLLVGVSLPSASLTFAREDDRYRAGYEIRAVLRQGGAPVREVSAREQVRVGTFPETARADESVIFQEFVGLAPGPYELELIVRDLESARTGVSEASLTVPRLGPGNLSSPVVVHDAEARISMDAAPDLIASPRATGIFGRDSVITVYVEAYHGDSTVPLLLEVLGDRGASLYRDTVAFASIGALFSGTVALPVARLGIGASRLTVRRTDTGESSSTPIIVGFGDDLPLVTFDQMLEYLQFYASAFRLRSLRDGTLEDRARLWGEFLDQTDPDPMTPEHEGLHVYFRRIAYANVRFREEGSLGWRSDRGMVYVSFGEPDQVIEQTRSELSGRGRMQIWEYRQHRLQLLFVDQTGFGRWRLSTSSEAEFRSALARTRER